MRHALDTLLSDKRLKNKLLKKKISVLGHPASVGPNLEHTLDRLWREKKLTITSCFGPQHGMRGDKQDNMIESDDYIDPKTGIPVFSLYGKTRRMTPEMMDTFDVVLIDMQDIGCRIYTYLTTLYYVMVDCAQFGKEVWVLDRPNPAGRAVEGTYLEPGWESFVGFGPTVMRHGLTLGEMALWIKNKYQLNLELTVVPMKGYKPEKGPGFGYPFFEQAWVNPSPNIPTLSSTRCFAGTVLTEGTLLSEGRGTTRALELFGAPNFPSEQIIQTLYKKYNSWTKGCLLRPCYFEPTFHKFKGQLCSGIQIHTDFEGYDPNKFKPYRLMLAIFKILKSLNPELMQWRQPPYEYETERLPIDLLNGGDFPRKWVDDLSAEPGDLEARLKKDETKWRKESRPFLLY
jgi:uncharacterized protein YbbC (DUF1343 family)